MKIYSNNTQAFFALLRAGLWEQDVRLSDPEKIDFEEIHRLAEQQSVVGIVAAGLEHLNVEKPPKAILLQFVGQALQLEQQNKAMNSFIAMLVDKLRKADIYVLLVKGQGIAQCYERPLLRACGDIDLLLSDDNYTKAKSFLTPLASSVDNEGLYAKHLGMQIDNWTVELHGTLNSGLSHKIDNVLKEVQDNVFYGGIVRSWLNGNTQVFIPGVDIDVVFVFSHILQHFFKGGIGLRQICDWCRLLWTYKDTINHDLLEKRIRAMGLMSEWKAFAALSVEWLGMPKNAMPYYSPSVIWKRKARRVISFVLETGNFGHNRDYSYFDKYPFFVYKMISFWRNTKDSIKHFFIFPIDALKVWFWRLREGIQVALKGE